VTFTVHPEVAAATALLAGAYLLAAGRVGGAPGWRRASFLGGLAVLFLALNGPLHDLAEQALASAHMLQHLLLTLALPPLLLAGLPERLGRPLAAPPLRWAARPLPALLLFAAVLSAWHAPALYEWALRDHQVHVLQHLTLMGAGVLLWCPVLSPLAGDRLTPPARLLYLFLAGIPMVPVAAFLTLSEEVLYPFYGQAATAWGLTPLADQRLGGVLMWVGGPLAFLAAMTVVYFQWVSQEEEPVHGAA
jgi:cytochrome c oxidase assembly factor CtaG